MRATTDLSAIIRDPTSGAYYVRRPNGTLVGDPDRHRAGKFLPELFTRARAEAVLRAVKRGER